MVTGQRPHGQHGLPYMWPALPAWYRMVATCLGAAHILRNHLGGEGGFKPKYYDGLQFLRGGGGGASLSITVLQFEEGDRVAIVLFESSVNKILTDGYLCPCTSQVNKKILLT